MRSLGFIIFPVLSAFLLVVPTSASALPAFEVTGWIPYWRTATGTANVLPHLDSLTEVNPFVYTLRQDGTLADNGALTEEPWKGFIAEAKKRQVRVIPTIMSSNRELMYGILSDSKKRAALEDEIIAIVTEGGYDGIDIDFEGKSYETREHFSAFLKELRARMGDKWLMCTIETRIPIADQYYGITVPDGAGQYANDLGAINTYCDRVRLMAYDQQGIDLKLKADAGQRLYAPVGDPAWVEKVINHMSQEIAKDKILIGVPTYGYEYSVRAYANNDYMYDVLWVFNPGYATPIAAQYGITPERAYWGELAFSYVPLNGTTTPPEAGSVGALAAAAAASQLATQRNTNLTFRYVVWPDEVSVQQKIDLAKRLGVRGVSVFKFDGGQDPDIWRVLAAAGAVKDNAVVRIASSAAVAGAAAAAPAVAASPKSAAVSFSRQLKLNAVGADVKALQVILNSDKTTRIASSGPGSPGKETERFGALTLAAVKKFQQKYGIAKPGNAGFGLVGPATRAKLNTMFAD
jgi:spore germination protein YaaH